MTYPPPARPRILITRTRQQASELALAVERMGAEPLLVPLIEVVPPSSFAELDDAIRLLCGRDEAEEENSTWLVVTSANAVKALARRAQKLALVLQSMRVAAIGPATAKSVVEAGLATSVADVATPDQYIAESLAAMLLARCKTPRRFLLVRAEDARDIIPTQLQAAGHNVRIVPAYRNQSPPDTLTLLRSIFADEASYPNVITFTSSSTARNLIDLLASIALPIPNGIALASIGPITSATLREFGYEPTFEADQATIESLAAAIEHHLRRSQ